MDSPVDITKVLREWADGETGAYEQLLSLVYPTLRKIASIRLAKEGRSPLQTTELVHETYLKLIDQNRTDWKDRNHFYAVASTLVRRILVDHARQRSSAKRGGDFVAITLDESLELAQPTQLDWIALDECLTQLEEIDDTAARVVELRFFVGLSIDDTADTLNIGRTSAVRKWRLAKTYLKENWWPD